MYRRIIVNGTSYAEFTSPEGINSEDGTSVDMLLPGKYAINKDESGKEYFTGIVKDCNGLIWDVEFYLDSWE